MQNQEGMEGNNMGLSVNLNEDRLVTKKEVAEKLGVSKRSIDRLVSLRRLTKVCVLGAIRFRLSEVMEIIKGGAS